MGGVVNGWICKNKNVYGRFWNLPNHDIYNITETTYLYVYMDVHIYLYILCIYFYVCFPLEEMKRNKKNMSSILPLLI